MVCFGALSDLMNSLRVTYVYFFHCKLHSPHAWLLITGNDLFQTATAARKGDGRHPAS